MKAPQFLYKYMSAKTASIVLKSQRLRWSCPSSFNDINELQRMPVFTPSIDEAKTEYLKIIIDIAFDDLILNRTLSEDSFYFVELIKLLKNKGTSKDNILIDLTSMDFPIKSSEDILREHTENYNNGKLRVVCLSEDNNNEVMWAHYGDSHTGCMFEFKHIEKLETPFLMAKKINYSDKVPVLGSAVDFLLYGYTKKLLVDTSNAIYFTKTAKWSYEKEWRVMISRPNEIEHHSDFKLWKEEINSVTFGARCRNEVQDELTIYIKENYPNCLFYKVFLNKGIQERKQINCL